MSFTSTPNTTYQQNITMANMTIDINLAAQEEAKNKTLFRVLGAGGVAFIGLVLLYPDYTPTYLVWIPLLPGIINALVYALGKKKIFANNFPYLRANEERIETFKGGFFSKPVIHYWRDARSIDVKLFAIELTSPDGTVSSINLENLTDENLKLVKDFVMAIKKKAEV